ncbi:cbb3-type cytochrome oxidase subunit 3 [Kingella negevensis]|uniref:Cbb3-type cytochrome oxidase component FixQ n=1 Tax=Kingella negevensis TaxID=1522312 RepID=A0A238HI38_9NEIS|nr:CcoQ/FixQ family Cbb3-type cytochrome c oxidase assembly chaperone [Kingella negevensis]MDK4680936.1 CcoQ/FixQ family Cbb3-type cytochrome c oxidase assembly chaperone [Kingella negevensis]MDK4683138.1 CcoQ/FixQ family Cbb3-type cytochrome c oxidase assembly chaperone [Kingella negevensis]MDK4683980.1 CcoQ/FixQ family Cbb3-type cytochrome c oxidase assembly chaperone [Kingella negevensis]MDK4687993.1 CcoQ/FixQ family Cbb3-type cytochrome c oxidase assembly chaperone [Kingella negevensis]MDK
MDLTWASSLFTVGVFISFVLVLFIVFSRKNKANYQDAANSIMQDDDTPNAQANHDNGA